MIPAGRNRAAEPGSRKPPAASAGNGERQALLSPREQQVMQLLMEGMDNRRIAERLEISHRTVEVHKARVLDKLKVRSVVDLVRTARGRERGPAD
jgi:two-component system response regulator DctR